MKNNVELIQKEFNYANHIGISTLLIDCPDDAMGLKHLTDLINRQFISLSDHFNEHQAPSVCIKISIVSNKLLSSKWRRNIQDTYDDDDAWDKWNYIRMLSQSNPKLFLALELNGDTPDQERLNRWLGEPIVMLIIPTSMFLTNSSKYPVLSKLYQLFIQSVNFKMAGNFSFIIRGNNLHGHIKYYSQYINHLKTTELFVDKISKFCLGYEDVLQIPLQVSKPILLFKS